MQRRRGLKKVGGGVGGASCSVATDKFPTDDIITSQRFNFAFKFSLNEGFSVTTF